MAENTNNRLTRMLLSKGRRAQYLKVFAVLAACVVVVVAVVLHQNGVAMTHEEQVLTCPVTDVVAHTHDESCYDEDGNLVCALPELELHTHTDECYNETRELTCGLEESEPTEESEGHIHTDECYTVTRELACGKEEITEEHVHGPGCFTTVTVENDDASAEVPSNATEVAADEDQADAAMPAQSFDDEILDENGNLWVHVSVTAPEGAFPVGTTMRIAPLDAEAVRGKVVDALKKEDDKVTDVRQIKAVDISFFDAEGNEIEPAVEVEVKITSDTVRDTQNPVLVHVDKDENKDAEVLKKVEVVNEDEEDATEDTKDTFKFESNEFSPYVIAEPVTIAANVITASGETYEITASYGTEAALPADATLEVTEVVEGDEGYEDYATQTAEALNAGTDTFSHLRMFDITIRDSYGNKLEPAGPVEVQINYVGDAIEDEQEVKVVHLADAGAEVIDPTAEGNDGAIDEVTFTADSFSIYSIVAWKQTANLDGKKFAIVHLSTRTIENNTSVDNNTRYLGRALQAVAPQQDRSKLKAANVAAEAHESGEYLVTTDKNGTFGENLASAEQITEWTFTAAGETNSYYISAGDNRYLHIDNDRLTLSNDPQAITVVAQNDGRVKLKSGTKYVRSSVNEDTGADNGDNPTFGVGNNDDKKDKLTLCQIEAVVDNSYPSYAGEKISVSDLVDGNEVIIYRTVFNEATGNYEDYVIDGNGNAVRAYDKGNALTLYSQVSPIWVLSICLDNGSETGYYLFKNEQTGLILHPLADGTLVKEYDQSTSAVRDGVALAGRKAGEYTSTIEYWDESVREWVGYQFTNGASGITLEDGASADSQELSFAKRKDTTSTNELHTVSTIDSAAKGIHIHMFDYPNRNTIANVTGSDSYTVAQLPAVHTEMKLENGYPKFTNGKSGSTLFSTTNNNYYKGDATNLFLESVYNSTGYYEYSSFNNFARYNEDTGIFTVYAEQATPYPTHNAFYDRRGNFFPYNDIDTTIDGNSVQNLYNGDGKLLDYEDPSNGSTLFGLQSLNHYFGMSMDFSFLMPKDGQIDGNPLIYEFNGDDDLWVYIDGVLLLDIGGVHDSWSGTINLATGDIIYDQTGRGANTRPTTIKACFQAAGVFPDGSRWDNNKVDNYFNGNTFVEFGSHQFNMFFMEHGAECSTLYTRFNLPVIEQGKVVVAKELSNTTQSQYANVSFAYQMFKKEGGKYVLVDSDATKTDTQGNTTDLVFNDNIKFSGNNTTYNKVFYLKPGEKATFTGIVEDQDYYVQEIGINHDYYDEIYVNNVKIDGQNAQQQNGVYRSTDATPRNRAQVTFTNHCDNRNVNELLITKRLAEGTPDVNDTFEFRVLLENGDGELTAYYQGKYYIRDDNNTYYRYENGKLVSNGETPYAYKAGNYGTIDEIPANYTVVIKDLVAGTDFYVDEIRTREAGTDQKVLIGESDWELVGGAPTTANHDEAEITSVSVYDYATNGNKTVNALGSIAWNKDAQVTFTNQLPAANINLKKANKNDVGINGSTFNLTRKVGNTWSAVASDIKPEGTGDNEGTISLGQLRSGLYRLEETNAPNGYFITEKYTYFKVYKNEDGNVIAAIVKEDGTLYPNSENAHMNDAANTVVVINTLGSELPATGGIGTTVIYAMGAGVVAMAGLGMALNRRRNSL